MPKKTHDNLKNKVSSTKQATTGYLPDVYKEFVLRYPDVSQAIDIVAQKCHEAG
jgi:hypothetical protein